MDQALDGVSGMVGSMVREGDGHDMVKLECTSNPPMGLKDDAESVSSRSSSSKASSVAGKLASDCTIIDRIQETIDKCKARLKVEMSVIQNALASLRQEVGTIEDLVQTRQRKAETPMVDAASCIDPKLSSPSPTENDMPGASGEHGGKVECKSVRADVTAKRWYLGGDRLLLLIINCFMLHISCSLLSMTWCSFLASCLVMDNIQGRVSIIHLEVLVLTSNLLGPLSLSLLWL